jgi:hypothetical protein
MQNDYKTVLEFLDYPQRFAYTNPLTDRGKKVRWATHSGDFHRLIKLVSKLPPAESKHIVRFIELYKGQKATCLSISLKKRRLKQKKALTSKKFLYLFLSTV